MLYLGNYDMHVLAKYFQHGFVVAALTKTRSFVNITHNWKFSAVFVPSVNRETTFAKH